MRTEREVRNKLVEYQIVLADLHRRGRTQHEEEWKVGDSLWVALSNSGTVVEVLEWLLGEREGLSG